MRNPEVIIKSNIERGLNTHIDRMQSKPDPVIQALTLGNVYDKDEAAKELKRMQNLYRNIGIKKQQAKELVKDFEDRVFGGTREEQIRAARELEATSNGLTKAIQKVNETQQDKT